MKILVVSGGYPTEKYPLNGTFQFEQAKALKAAGHEVVFSAVDLRSIRRLRRFGISATELDGIKIISISVPVGALPPRLVGKCAILGTRALFNHIRRLGYHPEIVHAHFAVYYGMASALNMAIFPSAKLVVTEHDSGINEPSVTEYTLDCMKTAYSASGVVIAVGQPLQSRILELTGIKAICTPNMFDDSLFSLNTQYIDKLDSRTDFTFVSVGSLIQRKRMDHLIDAFHLAFKGNSNFKLHIIGEGPNRASLETQISILGLKDQVKLLGSLPRKEIADSFRKSDCFVTASENETFGLACVEALACGIPVIATRCNGPEYFIDDDNGMLVDVGDKEGMASALLEMANKRNRYDDILIAKTTSYKFSPGAVTKAIGSVYEKLSKGQS